jgi:acyl-CoA reductase-like NAD-dependent aldehyde dehydrogenase
MSVELKGEYGLFIGGEWVRSASGETFESANPATGEPLARVAAGTAEDIDRAVAAAWEAYRGSWQKTDANVRGRTLFQIAQKIKEHSEELAQLETLDNGKTLTESRLDMYLAVECFEYYGGAATKLEGATIPVFGNRLNYVVREPWGVVGQIIPWNFPLLMAAWKLAPALAAGNCVVLKPAEQTPLTALRLSELIQEIVPKGVLNVVTGFGPEAGAPLVKHPEVKKIAFTGSTEVGRQIMAMAAEHVADVTLELGGKSPQIVYPDADLDAALEGVLLGIFYNAGQQCSAGSRLFLHEDVYDGFIEKLRERAEAIRVGDPTKPESQMGPLVSREQQKRVLSCIELGVQEGATLLTGGRAPEDPELERGCYVLPTIFTDVDNAMTIAQEEIFGPVLCVLTWQDEAEMFAQANGVPYGLCAGIWTRDLLRAHRAARRIEAGYIWINQYDVFPYGAPFGGYKQSGIGRELAFETLYHYTQTKNVDLDLSGKPTRWFQ